MQSLCSRFFCNKIPPFCFLLPPGLKKISLKKAVALFLFICLIVPFTGTFCWLHFQKSLVKKKLKTEIIAHLDQQELVFLKFSKAEKDTRLKWEHAKEFEYQGQMYDIVKSELTGDSVSYWCWPDHEETRLNRNLNKLVAMALGVDPQNKENQQHLMNFIKTLYHADRFQWSALPFPELNLFPCTCTFVYASLCKSPPVPPPEFV